MSIDFIKVLKAPADIDNWLLKILIGGLIYLIPVLCFVAMGYWTEYLINFMHGSDKLPDGPSDNIAKNFITGAKMFAGCLILGVIIGLILACVAYALAKLKCLALFIVMVLQLIMLFISLFLVMSFATDKKILSMIDLKKAAEIVKGNPETAYFILFMLLLFVIYSAVMGVCCATVAGAVFLPFLSYALGVSMFNLMGQYVQSSPNLEQLLK